MSILEWIDFGKVSAERDDHLSDYFYDNGVLQASIDSPSTFLLLGRKGAGKTAIFKFLHENREKFLDPEDVLLPLSFDDYNWNIHAVLADETKAASMVYKQSWRFVILAETVKALYSFYEQKGDIPKPIKKSGVMLEKLFGTPTPSVYQLVGQKILDLSKIKMPNVGLDIEDGEFAGLNADGGEVNFDAVKADANLKKQLTDNIDNVTSRLEKSLKQVENWPRVFICFDRVDEAWDDVSYDSSRRVIGGLVAAGDSISSNFDGRLRPLIFLREDIFETLSINDSNKLREDCGRLLHWTKPSLGAMALLRVNHYGAQAGIEPITDLDSLFDKNEMRQRAKPFNYILRRTMMRPRDLIALLSKTVASMKEKADDPFSDDRPNFEKLECDSIYAAEPAYSEWLKQELIDEWSVQQPNITRYFLALQGHGSTNITRQQFSERLRALIAHVSDDEIFSHLRFLYDNSVIGFKIGASNEWRFKCFYPSQGFIEADDYRVHDGLVRALRKV